MGIVGPGRKGSTIDDEAGLRWLLNYDATPSSHASAYIANPRTRIVAVAARTPESLKRFSDRWKLHSLSLYTDYREMLEKESLDIVSVTTHADLHAEVTVAAVNAGVMGVVCEKPMATSLEECDEMIEACDKSGTVLLVNHPRRFHPAFQRAKERLEQGAIGELYTIIGMIWPPLIHNGTHVFDMLRFFAGEADWALGYVARVGSDAGGYGMVHFESGVTALVDVASNQACEFQLLGSDGRLAIDQFTEGFQLCGYRDLAPTEPDRPWYQFRPRARSGQVFPSGVFKPPMQAAVQELIDCMGSGRTPRSSGREGRAGLELALVFHISTLKNSSRVALPLGDRSFRVLAR